MNIHLSPQVSDGADKLEYYFEGDVLTAEFKGVKETLDFTGVPDGKLELIDDEGNSLFESNLEVEYIISAERVEGVLYLELLNFIDSDATEKEKFPEWVESKDYIGPVEEVEPDEDE